MTTVSGAMLRLALASAALVCDSAHAADRANENSPRWQRIEYLRVPIPGAHDRFMSAYITGGNPVVPHQPPQLRFALSFFEPAGQERPASLARPEEFIVRMHFADGPIVEAETDPGIAWEGVGRQAGMTSSRSYVFPWARNAYDEAWIEWRLSDRTFWFEVPYGFTRDPTQHWPASDAERSAPRLAPALQRLGADDRLVPWRFVEYPVGQLPNRLHLTVRFANPFRPAAEVVLNHNFEAAWTADTPKTAIKVENDAAETTRVAFRSQGSLLRIDTFRLHYRGSDEGRGSGIVAVSVDNHTAELRVPSSLFKYLHGTADHEHNQRLPRRDDLLEQLIQLSD